MRRNSNSQPTLKHSATQLQLLAMFSGCFAMKPNAFCLFSNASELSGNICFEFTPSYPAYVDEIIILNCFTSIKLLIYFPYNKQYNVSLDLQITNMRFFSFWFRHNFNDIHSVRYFHNFVNIL